MASRAPSSGSLPLRSSGGALLLALLPAGLLAACAGGEGAAPAERRDTAPLVSRALEGRAAEELVLDARADGTVLLARVEPAPANADPVRALSVRWRSGGREVPLSPGGRPLADARLLPDGGLLVVGVDGTLALLEGPEATPVVLDRDVAAPLDVTPDGRLAVYVRGEMPDFQVTLLDVAGRTTREVAPEVSPAWCPAISADGRTIVFAASAGGYPELYQVDEGGTARQLTRRRGRPDAPPVPTGPSAPVLLDDRLLFEDGAGVHLLDLEGRAVSHPGLRAPVRVGGSDLLLVHATSGEVRLVSLDELRGPGAGGGGQP